MSQSPFCLKSQDLKNKFGEFLGDLNRRMAPFKAVKSIEDRAPKQTQRKEKTVTMKSSFIEPVYTQEKGYQVAQKVPPKIIGQQQFRKQEIRQERIPNVRIEEDNMIDIVGDEIQTRVEPNLQKLHIQKEAGVYGLPDHQSISSIEVLSPRKIVIGTVDGSLYTLDSQSSSGVRLVSQLGGGIDKVVGLNSSEVLLSLTQSKSSSSQQRGESSSLRSNLVLYDLQSNQVTQRFNTQPQSPITSILCVPSCNGISSSSTGNRTSSMFTTGDLHGNISIWSSSSQNAISTTRVHSSRINSMCFIHNNTTILSGGDDSKLAISKLVDNNTGLTEIREIKDFQPIKMVRTFLKRTNFCLTVSQEGVIKVWDLKQKK